MDELTFPQRKLLKELKKKHGYELATAKELTEDEDFTQKDVLKTLIFMEMNQAVADAVTGIMEDYTESRAITEVEGLEMVSMLMAAMSVSGNKRLKELGEIDIANRLSGELLYLYNEENPDIKMVVFAEDNIHTYTQAPDISEFEDESDGEEAVADSPAHEDDGFEMKNGILIPKF